MRVYIHSQHGQRFGGLNLIDVAVLSAILFGGVNFLLNPESGVLPRSLPVLCEADGKKWLSLSHDAIEREPEQCAQLTWTLEDVVMFLRHAIGMGSSKSLATSILPLLTLIAVSVTVYRVSALVLQLLVFALRPFTHRSAGLMMRKLRQELRSVSPITTSALAGARTLADIRHEKIKNFKSRFPDSSAAQNILTTIDWRIWDMRFKSFRDLALFDVSSESFNSDRKATLKKLESLGKEIRDETSKQADNSNESAPDRSCDGEQYEVVFLVASVQPSIIHAATRIVNRAKLSKNLKVSVRTTNGPATVQDAVALSRDNKEKQSTQSVCFVAPLAAYLMFEGEGLYHDDAIDDIFFPISSLIEERQEVLYVEDYSRLPSFNRVPRARDNALTIEDNDTKFENGWERRLIFYDNSTSEECVANISSSIVQSYSSTRRTSYSEFKQSLSKSYLPGTSLEPGDAIALWEPLITAYAGRKVGRGTLRTFPKRDEASTTSQIYLFGAADLDCADRTKAQELARSFLRALQLEMRELKRLEEWRLLPIWRVFNPALVLWVDTFILRWRFARRFRDVMD